MKRESVAFDWKSVSGLSLFDSRARYLTGQLFHSLRKSFCARINFKLTFHHETIN